MVRKTLFIILYLVILLVVMMSSERNHLSYFEEKVDSKIFEKMAKMQDVANSSPKDTLAQLRAMDFPTSHPLYPKFEIKSAIIRCKASWRLGIDADQITTYASYLSSTQYQSEPVDLAELGICLSRAHHLLGDMQKMGQYSKMAMDLAKHGNSNQSYYHALFLHSSTKYLQGQHAQAIEGLTECYNYYSSINDKLAIGIMLNEMGNVYEALGDYEKSISYYLQYIEASAGSDKNVSTGHYNLADTYIEIDQPHKALEHLAIAIKYMKRIDDQLGLDLASFKSAEAYRDLNQPKESLKFATVAEAGFRKLGNDEQLALTRLLKAEAYIQLASMDKAQQELSLVRTFAEAGGRNGVKKNLEYTTANFFSAKKDFQKALEHTNQAYQLEKLINKLSQDKKISQLQVEFDVNKKDYENKVLQQESRNKNIVLVAFVVILFSIVMVYGKDRVIHVQRENLAKVLDVIEEGILTLDDRLKVIDGYSSHVLTLIPDVTITVGEPVLNQIFEFSSLPIDHIDRTLNALHAVMHEEELVWEINASHLPSEISLKDGRVLSLSWQPLFGNKGTINRLLLCLKDITSLSQLIEERETLQSIQRKVGQLVLIDSKHLDELTHQVRGTLALLGGEEGILAQDNTIKNALHKYKGISRSLSLFEITERIHELESEIRRDKADMSKVQSISQQINKELDEYQQAMELLYQYQRKTETNDGMNFAYIFSDIKKRLATNGFTEVSINFNCQTQEQPERLHPILEEILLHSLNNSVDHGYINFPAKPVNITITISQKQQVILVAITDDGAGIDHQAIKKLAAERHFPYSTEDELLQIIFEEGTSTSPGISVTSGRGTGMAAIKDLVQSYGGEVKIQNRQDRSGTILKITIDTSFLKSPQIAS